MNIYLQKPEVVSIIMASYNAQKTIESAIKSVLAQTYMYWELIIINDCSTDNTLDIVTKMAVNEERIQIIENHTNIGVSRSREKGLKKAKGDWIAVLDSDDIWESHKLEKQLKLAYAQGAELIFTGSAFINDEGEDINWQLHVPVTLSYRQLLKQNLISNSSVLVKADLYRKYYAVGDNMHEDFSIWLGITKEGKMAYGIDEPLLIYRIAKSSKSSNKLKAAMMNWNTYRYSGLNLLETIYYMCWYSINGIIKYRHLR